MAQQINWVEAELKGLRLPDMETGREWLEQIRRQNAQTLEALRANASDNTKYRALLDDSYKLKQAKHKVQSLMTALFKARRVTDNAIRENAS